MSSFLVLVSSLEYSRSLPSITGRQIWIRLEFISWFMLGCKKTWFRKKSNLILWYLISGFHPDTQWFIWQKTGYGKEKRITELFNLLIFTRRWILRLETFLKLMKVCSVQVTGALKNWQSTTETLLLEIAFWFIFLIFFTCRTWTRIFKRVNPQLQVLPIIQILRHFYF